VPPSTPPYKFSSAQEGKEDNSASRKLCLAIIALNLNLAGRKKLPSVLN
jgi:hypothetical protein